MEYKKLVEAVCSGDIDALNNFLQENPLLLVDYSLMFPKNSLLHIAVKAQQPRFVRELLTRKLDLAYELNEDGLRPIDIASIIGNIEIIREFISADPEIVGGKGRDKRTALHHAAIYGRADVVDEIMTFCDECILDVTDYEETALHLALKNNRVDAFCALLKWVEMSKSEFILNWVDCDGNTALHIATSTKQLQCIKLLVSGTIGNTIQVNAKNFKGSTPMDLLDIVIENPNDFHIKDILAQAGSLRALDMINNNHTSPILINQTEIELIPDRSKNWFHYFKFQDGRDSPSDVRNTLLVVAALIATISFQAGVNPPSVMIKQNSSPNTKTESPYAPPPGGTPKLHPGGTLILGIFSAILGSNATPLLFVFFNTLGFASSLSVIIYLTGGFPFQRELLMSMYSMMFSYGFSMNSATGNDLKRHLFFLTALSLPFVLRWMPFWGKRAWKRWRRTSQHSRLPIGT